MDRVKCVESVLNDFTSFAMISIVHADWKHRQNCIKFPDSKKHEIDNRRGNRNSDILF